MAYVADAWAAHGYIVVALQHAGSDEALWKDVPPAERMDALKRGMTVSAYLERCRDVHFAIDELGRRNDADGPLHGRIDLPAIGIAGHSFGAQTVQAIIGQRPATARGRASKLADDRVKAAVAFSPQYERENAKEAFADVKIPCFHFTGTMDEGIVGSAKPTDRRVPFDAIDADEQYLVILDGGDHMVFSGNTGGTLSRADPARYPAWHALIVDLTTHFWDAELREDADAKRWLREQARTAVGKAGTFEMHATTTPATSAP